MLKIAIVGVTGLVGNVLLKVMEERNFDNIEFFPVASKKSVGKEITFFNKTYKVIDVDTAIEKAPDIAIFSAGSATSLEYAPRFAENGTFVIDNSSAWRMYNNVPLVVPEINSNTINENTKIIANPNCSTIQMVMVLAPLHLKYKIRRLVISTYQSVTGTGVKAVKQLENETLGVKSEMAYPYQIYKNILPHGGSFLSNLYTTEEQKLIDETRKILSDDKIRITSTVVRVPVTGGHSMSVNIEFESDFNLEEIKKLLSETNGVVLQDNVKELIYPMPLNAEGKDEVFVGRIRRDESNENSLNLWIVADNLRKGAATNAVQIAQYLLEKDLIKIKIKK